MHKAATQIVSVSRDPGAPEGEKQGARYKSNINIRAASEMAPKAAKHRAISRHSKYVSQADSCAPGEVVGLWGRKWGGP